MDDIQTALSFVVRTTAVGGHDLSDMHKAIPNLVVLVDHQHDAMANFLNAMNYTNGPCVHLGDDVIQFFSMRKDDVTIGTRYIAGSQFMMNQCFYLPAGLGPKIADAWKTSARQNEAGAPYDLLMADYFKAHKMKYLNWCPNLVDHEVCVSRIDKRRSSKRQSLTFVK